MILSEHTPLDLEEALDAIAGLTAIPGSVEAAPVVLLYTRVSSDIQLDEGYSLETQSEALRRECLSRFPDGCHIIWVADEGLSGALFWKKPSLGRKNYRPGLTLLVELIDSGLVSAIGVYRCNRLCRRTRIWLELLEDHLAPKNVLFFSAAEGIDTASPGTATTLQILMSGAEHERATIAGNVKEGLGRRREEGYYCGCPPYGWRWQDARFVPEGQRIGIEPVAEEAETIRRIVGWYLAGKSPYWIAGELTRTGTVTATGATVWHVRVVKRILWNPTSAGLIGTSDGDMSRGQHCDMKIVEPETYHAVQDEMKRRREKSIGKDKPKDLLFHELLTCSICGGTLQIHGHRYVCPGRRSGKEHRGFWMYVSLVEQRLEKMLLSYAESVALGARAAARIRQEHEAHVESLHREEKRVQARLTRNAGEICLWAARSGDSEYEQSEAEDELQWLTDERKDLEAHLESLKKEMRQERSGKAKCEAAAQVARNVGRLWPKATLEEKRELARALITGIIIEPAATGITVHVKLVTDDMRDIHFYVRAKVPKGSGDLWAIGPELLRTAYYLSLGMRPKDIAETKGVLRGTVYSQIWQLKKLTGAKTADEIAEILRPVLEARRDELEPT